MQFGEAVKEAMRQGYNDGGKAGYVEGGNVTSMEASITKMYTDYGTNYSRCRIINKNIGKSIRDLSEDTKRKYLKEELKKYKFF